MRGPFAEPRTERRDITRALMAMGLSRNFFCLKGPQQESNRDRDDTNKASRQAPGFVPQLGASRRESQQSATWSNGYGKIGSL